MENIVINIVSVIIQTLTWSYFLEKFCKLVTNSNYTKKQIIIHVGFILLSTIAGTITKNTIPFINTLLTWIIIFIDLKLNLKVSILKTIFSILALYILLIITELISFFICRQIFKISYDELFNFKYAALLLLIIQQIFILLVIKLIVLNKTKSKEIRKIFSIYNPKHILTIIALLFICICPQFLIFMFNDYNYPAYFILINCIQMIIVCIVLFYSFKNTMEKEKAENDLIAANLHNKTITGMVDGVKKLKHDYSNIFQSLNGYISTKQYDKLEAHIKSVIGECNDINNLAVITPEIFNDPAIYGIVGAKYFLAIENNIKFDLDIATNIAEINFSMPDLSRILGILLDNAIEATSKLENNKYIKLEMRFDNKKYADVIRIYNTYDTNVQINTSDIFKKGYSSKKVKSGIGLWEVQKLIKKSGNSQIFACVEKEKFIQNIIIEK